MTSPIIELYELTQPLRFVKNYTHTDSIRFLKYLCETDLEEDRRGRHVVFDKVINWEEYRDSVEANLSDKTSKEDFPSEGRRIIVYA